ncbi:DUF397 domain-containing protein [Nocardiopsis alba]|uniref:DUF397 domain-containing protein n=1 Tax=Nocardiopsis alba (strain ATCC BAA-2165 / BE74) TaxID=1205910 RepID=J7L3F4_NOCAA|nr:DUF397 domain-containing protein [Nocardiopsis alba]AFR08168.1 hypothetical protein B005_3697 [Nocardiopsis alba ATCC BAA-2165]
MRSRTRHWFKSSYSGTSSNCVEVTHDSTRRTPSSPWHKASYTNDRGACVEVSEGPITGVRDTKHRELGALFFNASEWQAFLGATRP